MQKIAGNRDLGKLVINPAFKLCKSEKYLQKFQIKNLFPKKFLSYGKKNYSPDLSQYYDTQMIAKA